MQYEVFARKTRPRTFDQVVGQEHVLRALSNGLEQGRVHHAFLFTGTRGVGKTTIARIFAKALNCETGVTSTPCGECSSCSDIDAGRFIDLIEIDAASRTGVDDIRELIDNVQYAPTRGRYKVYLIDEVHMLSNSAFNALLKTLEEPPPHVKFLLATTDPQKLPVTVLSRCLQFNLKRVPMKRIAEHLATVLNADSIESDPAALTMISRAAEGSLRDSLSLLDQAVAFGGGAVRQQDVREMLGSLERGDLDNLLAELAAGNSQGLFDVVERLDSQGADLSSALAELVTAIQRAALYQQLPAAVGEEEPSYAAIVAMAGQLSSAELQLFYQIALQGRRDIELAPDPRTGFEMVILRLLAFGTVPTGSGVAPAKKSKPAVAPATDNIEKSLALAEIAKPSSVEASDHSQNPFIDAPDQNFADISVAASDMSAPELDDMVEPLSAELEAALSNSSEWAQVVAVLDLSGLAGQLAMHCVPVSRDDVEWVLRVNEAWYALASEPNKLALSEALNKHIGSLVKVRFLIDELKQAEETPAQGQEREERTRQQQAEDDIHNDSTVKTLISLFDAEIRQGSIAPRAEQTTEKCDE
jgi:DNA polymerase-3 subunit gamma/tau